MGRLTSLLLTALPLVFLACTDPTEGIVIDSPEELAMPAQGGNGGGGKKGLCMTPEHILLWEDTSGILLDPTASFDERNAFFGSAADALIQQWGDDFDFVTYWVDFEPAAGAGGAYFVHVYNDIQGIGRSFLDRRALYGVNSDRLEGFVVMNNRHLLKGNPNNDNTIAHEFGHRWIAFVKETADGRRLLNQTNAHYNCKLDLGGGTLSPEWRGFPARQARAEYNVHTDGRYSYLDLYLMGYVDAFEMDNSGAEHRYLDDNDTCARYSGPVSTLSSDDIIDAEGPRLPDSTTAQKHFRTATVMVHLPGQTPSKKSIDEVRGIMDAFGAEWPRNTLNRGTMDVQLFTDADCDGVPD
jgi:hypothetical protein